MARWEHVAWSGPVKELRFIRGVEPSECLLVDNKPERIAPGRAEQVILIGTFSGREPEDRELERVAELFSARCAARAPTET